METLPSEIVGLIAGFADVQTIMALRLTCRGFFNDTFPAFATAFFGTVTIDLCPRSMTRLRRIANDERLCNYVHTVTFGFVASCSNPARHMAGTGFHWDRDPSSLCLSPSQPVVIDLRMAFSRLHNCQKILVSHGVSDWDDPRHPKATSLCMLDVLHLALLAASRLPSIRILRLDRSEHGCGKSNALPLLPIDTSALLEGNWARNLVEMHVNWVTSNTESIFPFCEVVQAAHSLRRLRVASVPIEFFRFLANAPQVPPLKEVDFDLILGITAQDLIDFTARFRNTLERTHLFFVHLAPRETAAADLGRVLRYWARNMPRFRSFGIQELRAGKYFYVVLLNQILSWDEVPDAGDMTIWVGTSGKRKGSISGFWYAGETEDVRKVLVTVAEWCEDQVDESHSTWGASPRNTEYLMVGRRKVRCIYRKTGAKLNDEAIQSRIMDG